MKRALVLIGLLAVAACSKTAPSSTSAVEAATPQANAVTTPGPAKPVPALLPDVLARVNGEPILKAEFEEALRIVEQRAGAAVPADQRSRVYRDVLDQLIGYRLLLQEVKTRTIDVAEAEINERIDVFKQHFGTPDEFTNALAAQRMTLEQFRDQARSEIRMAKMLASEVDSKVSVQPKDLTDFYQQNPDRFTQDERVRASHILIAVPANADVKVKEQARAKAESVLKQIKSGQDFAEAAKRHSQDPGNAQNGGDLGYFTRGQMVGAFERAAFALQPGGVSDVVETPFGFHIVKLAERQPAKTLTLDEVRPQLEQFLKERQRQEKTTAFVESLKSKGKIEILI